MVHSGVAAGPALPKKMSAAATGHPSGTVSDPHTDNHQTRVNM
jgi:hypothetical protein